MIGIIEYHVFKILFEINKPSNAQIKNNNGPSNIIKYKPHPPSVDFDDGSEDEDGGSGKDDDGKGDGGIRGEIG